MSSNHVFISHSSKDDPFVKELRLALEGHGIPVWVDSRNLRGGSKLAPEISEAIEQSRQVIAVLSPDTINSPWVRREIIKALEVEKHRKDEGYRVIPLMLPGIEPSALSNWFDEEPVGVRVGVKAGSLNEALPSILSALEGRLPDDFQAHHAVAPHRVEELILELSDLTIDTSDGKRRAKAVATLVYEPADASSALSVRSRRYTFTAPLGPIEEEDLRWYLESYYLWPTGVFKERAERIEAQLPVWGQDLFKAALGIAPAQRALNAWQRAADEAAACFTVFVERELLVGAQDEDQASANEAASRLLSLPWELLHDGGGYLFQGKRAVGVRRRLPNRRERKITPASLPIRVLLISPRPEEEGVGYIDHRISAKPLIDAVESLGELITVSILTPPTFPALRDALRRAEEAKQPFDVVHFDGHGIYDRKLGLGSLCFEDPNDAQKLDNRAMKLIAANEVAAVMRDYRIPLVFLEACQTAKVEEDPTASVAAKLLEEGVASVVAMSHSVLVETAHRFVRAFYEELARGSSVGKAMMIGHAALESDTWRGKIMGAGDLHLQDWFVPVLYQEEQDPQLVTQLPPKEVQQLQTRQRRLSLGDLLEEKEKVKHGFVGRSRELLALERLLHDQQYAVVRGQGGAGKTTLAVELADWLVRTGRFRRAAFVTFDPLNKKSCSDARAVLDSIGRQLLPEGEKWSVAQFPDMKQALQPVERALRDRPTIIVLDNLESVLPDQTGQLPPAAAPIEEFFELFQALLHADASTRLLFTTRESMPEPFDHRNREINLRELRRDDAIKLVSQVMAQEGLTPKAEDPGGDPKEIVDLVEAANCHARALTLLAREIAKRGVRATTENLHQLMADLDRKHPGDRENSLYASVELSLRRMPAELREQARMLGVFHGGAHLRVLDHVLGTSDDDVESAPQLAAALIEVGLAAAMSYGHLRLDPALPGYLLGQMGATQQEQARSRWAEAMGGLTNFLYEQQFHDSQLAAQLTLLELPNLLALLVWAQGALTPEEMVNLAGSLEGLLAPLGRPQALAHATQAREKAAQRLGVWSHAQVESLRQGIDRLLEQGRLPEAHAAAEQLLQRTLAAGEAAYAGAAYDIALAHFHLGRVLEKIGVAEPALSLLREAQQRFQKLAEGGDLTAEHMVAAAIIEAADCQLGLGRYDEAAAAYEEGIQRFEVLDDRKWAAVGRGQLGTVRLQQGRYAEALESHRQALRSFELLGEPGHVAIAWHQIGMAHRGAGQFKQAEQAYRQSLAIEVQQQNRAGEASSLGELGNLYSQMGRLEEATTFYRQASEIHARLQDNRYEGFDRSNLAATLIKLQRNDEARLELHRAIECKQPFGHAATIWTTWDILYDLERATGNAQAAEAARGHAVASYRAYRNAGGESQSNAAQLFATVFQAIQQGTTTETEQYLDELSSGDIPTWLQTLVTGLRAILRGDRDPALAADPNLSYMAAAELQLLLEALHAK